MQIDPLWDFSWKRRPFGGRNSAVSSFEDFKNFVIFPWNQSLWIRFELTQLTLFEKLREIVPLHTLNGNSFKFRSLVPLDNLNKCPFGLLKFDPLWDFTWNRSCVLSGPQITEFSVKLNKRPFGFLKIVNVNLNVPLDLELFVIVTNVSFRHCLRNYVKLIWPLWIRLFLLSVLWHLLNEFYVKSDSQTSGNSFKFRWKDPFRLHFANGTSFEVR